MRTILSYQLTGREFRSIGWLIKRSIKLGARFSCPAMNMRIQPFRYPMIIWGAGLGSMACQPESL